MTVGRTGHCWYQGKDPKQRTTENGQSDQDLEKRVGSDLGQRDVGCTRVQNALRSGNQVTAP